MPEPKLILAYPEQMETSYFAEFREAVSESETELEEKQTVRGKTVSYLRTMEVVPVN